MPTIALITTGECEYRALGRSLQGAFGDVDIEIVTPRPALSVTSRYLSYPAPSGGQTLVDKLVSAMLAELDSRTPPDLVLAIDDLELGNLETPHHVTQLVSDSVRRAFGRTPTHREVQRVRDRCSFHFLCPMLEAYFFGEPAALRRAGAARAPILDPSHHLEAFRAADAEFVATATEVDHPWRRSDRARHPKAYLCFLSDPGGTQARPYRETRDGCAALATLDWAQVFAYQPPGIAFAHALFDDLADALGVPNPFPGTLHPLTQRRVDGTLRNVA